MQCIHYFEASSDIIYDLLNACFSLIYYDGGGREPILFQMSSHSCSPYMLRGYIHNKFACPGSICALKLWPYKHEVTDNILLLQKTIESYTLALLRARQYERKLGSRSRRRKNRKKGKGL